MSDEKREVERRLAVLPLTSSGERLLGALRTADADAFRTDCARRMKGRPKSMAEHAQEVADWAVRLGQGVAAEPLAGSGADWPESSLRDLLEGKPRGATQAERECLRQAVAEADALVKTAEFEWMQCIRGSKSTRQARLEVVPKGFVSVGAVARWLDGRDRCKTWDNAALFAALRPAGLTTADPKGVECISAEVFASVMPRVWLEFSRDMGGKVPAPGRGRPKSVSHRVNRP
jgi:hypothetical protein